MSRFFSIWLVLVPLCAGAVRAQTRNHEEAYSDTLRAIIVFAKFVDDRMEEGAAVNFRDWPIGLAKAPEFGKRILAPSPRGPYPDSSLTAYYHHQSGGRFVIWGNAYENIYTSREPERAYHNPSGGYGKLTLEILEHLDEAGFDFKEYDWNKDGKLDYLFVVLRRDSQRDAKRMTWTGISCLDARCGGGLAGGPFLEAPVLDGIEVNWNDSGSILFNRTPGNVNAFWYHVRLMAHELGHDVWRKHFVHIPAMRWNDVPLNSNRDPKKSCIGYVLMAGAGGAPDCGGDYIISAFERDLLGWIECTTVDTTRSVSLTIGDLYSTSDCIKIPTHPEGAFLYLTNRQRIGPFDRRKHVGSSRQFDIGLLRSTGLLAMKVSGVHLDILPADNSLDLSTMSDDYAGDLYQHGEQLTPFSRPNISAYTRYRNNVPPVWFAIDNIRIDKDWPYELTVDFLPDFRTNPTFRVDSWIGPKPDSVFFTGDITLADNASLTLDGSHVSTGNVLLKSGTKLNVGAGSTLEVAGCGWIRVESGATLVNEGTIIVGGGILSRAGSDLNIVGGRFAIPPECGLDHTRK